MANIMNSEPLTCPECGEMVYVKETRTVTTINTRKNMLNIYHRQYNDLDVDTEVYEDSNRRHVRCGCRTCPFVLDGSDIRERIEGDHIVHRDGEHE